MEHEGKGVGRDLTDIAHLRPERNRRVGSHIDGGPAKWSVRQDPRGPVHTGSSPVVKPGPRGKIDMAVLHAGSPDRGHQEGAPPHGPVLPPITPPLLPQLPTHPLPKCS